MSFFSPADVNDVNSPGESLCDLEVEYPDVCDIISTVCNMINKMMDTKTNVGIAEKINEANAYCTKVSIRMVQKILFFYQF